MNKVNANGAKFEFRATFSRFDRVHREAADTFHRGLMHSFGDEIWFDKIAEFLRIIGMAENTIQTLLDLERLPKNGLPKGGTLEFRRKLFDILWQHNEEFEEWFKAEYDREFGEPEAA